MAVLVAIAAVVLAAYGTLAVVMAIQAAPMPYNSEGRYFDGVVVHHDGAQFIYGAVAAIAFVLAFGLAWLACRFARPGKSF